MATLRRNRFSRGFTLVELMITVVIIGILAAIAFPSYRTYMQQTRRSDAQIALTQLAAQEERFFTECNTYTTTIGGARACGGGLGLSTDSPQGYYSLTASGGAINAGTCGAISCGYTLVAAPKSTGPQAGNGSLRIDSTGAKGWDKDGSGNYTSKWTDK